MNSEALQEYLDRDGLDAILITSNPNIIYLTNFHNFSHTEREGYLLLTKKNQYIFTDARYSESALENIPHFIIREITAQKKLTDHILKIAKSEHITTLGFEANDLRLAEYRYFMKKLKGLKFKSTQNIIETFRMIKKAEEIEKIKAACRLSDQAFYNILPAIKPGITEQELAFLIESYFRQQAADISFEPIVAFGAHAAIPHHASESFPLTNESIVLLDFGAKVDNYCSDMTRTVFVKKPTNEEAKIYHTVHEAQKKAIERLQKQKETYEYKAKMIDKAARDYITSQGYPSIPHALGHGIGIEVHEAPVLSTASKDILKSGMVFSIEPGIYLKGKIGVRIEDLVYMKTNGYEILTKSPNKLIVL